MFWFFFYTHILKANSYYQQKNIKQKIHVDVKWRNLHELYHRAQIHGNLITVNSGFSTTPFFLFPNRFELCYVNCIRVALCFSIITNINPKSYFYKVLPSYFRHNRSFYVDITREWIYYLCMEFIISQLFFDVLTFFFFWNFWYFEWILCYISHYPNVRRPIYV